MTAKSEILEYAKQQAHLRLARKDILYFTTYTKKNYQVNWHHRAVCNALNDFTNGDIKKLMVNMPPQHGKTELCTRRLSAFLLGRNPNLRIAVLAYNQKLARKFCREIQRIMETPEYKAVFPGTRLNEKNVVTNAKGNYLKNSEEFEIVGHEGYLVARGIDGPLTSYTVDITIFDDPYKSRVEAFSAAYLQRVEAFYDDVIDTRGDNDSQMILTYTMWNYVDIGNKLLRDEAGEWTRLKIKGIKEGPDIDHEGNEIFEREEGDPLWEEKKSKEWLEKKKEKGPSAFQALYQQEPSPKSGNILKSHWFKTFLLSELPPSYRMKWVVDSAYTEEQKNDPTVIWVYTYIMGVWYVLDVVSYRKEWNESVLLIPDVIKRWDKSCRIMGRIEPKANGKSLVQNLRKPVYEGTTLVRPALNVIEGKPPTSDKVARTNANISEYETYKVRFLEGAAWIESVIEEFIAFDKGPHDDNVDCLNMMVDAEINGGFTVGGG